MSATPGIPMLIRSAVVLACLLLLSACGGDSNRSNAAGDEAARRGREVYLSTCIACHNSDPAQDGPLGPAVKGSSRELLEAKLLHGKYPPGYTPKQNTALMLPQPHLERSIADLAAFLK